MAWLEISGMPLRVQESSTTTAETARDQSSNGQVRNYGGIDSRAGQMRSYTSTLREKTESWFWYNLLTRSGNVWDFEANDDVSSNRVKTITAVTPASNNPKFGTYHLDRTGSDISLWTLPDAGDFTIIYHYDDGGGYAHVVSTRLPADGSDRIWVDGASNNGYAQPHTINGSNVVVLDVNGDFDDIIILPFGIPDSLAASVIQTTPFSSLPRLDFRGVGQLPRVVEVAGKPSLLARGAGSGAVYSISFDVQAYERAAP